VRSLEFGRGEAGRLLYAAMSSQLFVWDLVELRLLWTLPVGAEILSLASCPLSGHLAVLAKDHVRVLNTWERSTVATVGDVHAAGGGAVYGVRDGQAHLYYITYTGLVKRIGRRRSSWESGPEVFYPVKAATAGGLTLPKASGRTASEISAVQRSSGGNEDVAALLSVPLHALPAPSLLARSFLQGRLAALPRLAAPALMLTPDEAAASSSRAGDRRLAATRIQNIFQAEQKPAQPLDLKSFAAMLKKTSGGNKNLSEKH
jgi:hypothetical protein